MYSKTSKAIKLLLLFPALSFLPIPLAYRLARMLAPMDGKALEDYCTGLENGIKRVLTTEGFPTKDIQACIRENLNMLSMEIMDSFTVPRMGPEKIGLLSSITGVEHIKEASRKGKGLIIATSHFGRLLMTPFTLGIMGVKVRSLSQDVSKNNPYLDWVDRIYLQNKVKKLYKTSRIKGITLGEDLREIYRALRKNDILFILMDAYPPGVTRLEGHPFLGGVLKLPTGIERISQRSKAPLVYASVKPAKEWRVKVEIRPIEGYGKHAFESAVKELEKDVSKQPCQWWQWGYMSAMWSPTA